MHSDECMIRTTDAVCKELGENGLLRRYSDDDDSMEGHEGAFMACSFWLAECLARQGRLDEARQAFQLALAVGNDLGLFAEEFDPAADLKALGSVLCGFCTSSAVARKIMMRPAII